LRLLLVRHGYSEHVRRDLIADVEGCAGLAPHGLDQARRLAARFASSGRADDAKLFSSPVPRARQTADVLAPVLGAPVIDMADLRELVPGAADGLSRAEYAEKYGQFDPMSEPTRPFSPGGESWNEFRTRVEKTLDLLARTNAGKTVVAVSHAGFIVVAMRLLLGMSHTGQEAFLDPVNTAITEWTFEAGRWNLARYNDAAHLGLEWPGPAEPSTPAGQQRSA
jgi:probable phosphoglycerate mutase